MSCGTARATPALPDCSRFYQVHALLTVSLRPPTGSISKCDGPGPRFLALFHFDLQALCCWRAGRQHPGGRPPDRGRTRLSGQADPRRRAPRSTLQRTPGQIWGGQTSVQPPTLTRAVTSPVLAPEIQHRDLRPPHNSKTGSAVTVVAVVNPPLPIDPSAAQSASCNRGARRDASGRTLRDSSRGYPAVIRQMKLSGAPPRRPLHIRTHFRVVRSITRQTCSFLADPAVDKDLAGW